MKEYFEKLKKRAGVIILFGQMCIIIYQLGTLESKKVIICEPDQYQQRIVCVEQWTKNPKSSTIYGAVPINAEGCIVAHPESNVSMIQ